MCHVLWMLQLTLDGKQTKKVERSYQNLRVFVANIRCKFYTRFCNLPSFLEDCTLKCSLLPIESYGNRRRRIVISLEVKSNSFFFCFFFRHKFTHWFVGLCRISKEWSLRVSNRFSQRFDRTLSNPAGKFETKCK